jgi:hypothetical protein
MGSSNSTGNGLTESYRLAKLHTRKTYVIMGQGHISQHLFEQKAKSTSEKWGIQLIQLNWKYVLQMWVQHNQEVHGSTPEQQVKRKKIAMIDELKEIQMENHDM